MATVQSLLACAPQEVSRSETLLVLSHIMQKRRETLIAHPDEEVPPDNEKNFLQALEKMKAGFPTPYLVGTQEFWSYRFKVTPDVLIPRQDTETLIEWILENYREKESPKVLDLGTGSGAIAVTLALELKNARVFATDISAKALALAQENTASLNASVRFDLGSWFDAVTEKDFDLIVSNPPYIDSKDEHLSCLTFEPRGALTDGKNGLTAIASIVAQARDYLKKGSALILEHGYDQGEAVRRLMQEKGFANIKTLNDLGGNERATVGYN